MKASRKRLAMVILLTCILGTMTMPALAGVRVPFTLNVQCTIEDDNNVVTNSTFSERKYMPDSSIYVSHNVVQSSAGHANFFRARRSTNGGGLMYCGNKWVAPVGGGGIPIQDSAILSAFYPGPEHRYKVAARGNTKYYQYQNLTTLTLNGSYDVNFGSNGK